MVRPLDKKPRLHDDGKLAVLGVVADRFELGWLEGLLDDGSGREIAVEECRSPLEALQRAERLSFDVCFFDDRFGERAMLRFLHTLQAWGTPFPTVVLAASERSGLRAKALDAGAVDVLTRGELNRVLLGRVVSFAQRLHRVERTNWALSQRHRNLFERSQAPAYRLAADGTLLHCNQAFVQLLGTRRKEDVIGHPLLYVESPTQATPQPLARFGRRSFLNREICLCRADRSHVWLRMSDTLTSLDDQGALVFEGTAVVSRDKLAEDRLREREAQYTALYDAIAEGMLVLNDAGRVTACNRRAELLLGLEIDQLLGRTFPECFAALFGGDRQPLSPEETPPARTLATGEPVSGRVLGFRRRDGREGWASVRTTSIQIPGAKSRISVWVTLTDLTRLKELEGQLVRAQKMEVLGRMAGGMAHEFRNLLTAIVGYSELLLADGGLQPAAGLSVEEILRAAKRATSLSGQMLNFARRDEVEIEDLDLDELLGNLRSMLERLLGGRVRMTLELDSAGYRVCADYGQIQQVVLNLVLNARDAMPDGGRLWIRTESVDVEAETILDAAVANPDLQAGRYVVITVEDDGVGMDDSTLRRAFEPFFTTKSADKGTGLGLPAVRDIIRACGGEIRAHSAPGEGTQIRLFLPTQPLSAPIF